MNIGPVIERELRTHARQPQTYWLRLVGASILLLVIVLSGVLNEEDGAALFRGLNFTLFFSIWIMVPLLTSDCLSRERREGTLGLLFLTPLRPGEVVIAKALAHGLRAGTVGLAVLPVMALPLLMGGVSGVELTYGVIANVSAFFLALGAGLLGSAWGKAWYRAQATAAALAIVFLLGLSSLATAAQPLFIGGSPLENGFVALLDLGAQRTHLFKLASVAQQWAIARQALVLPLVSAATLILLIGACTHLIKRRWREEGPSARQRWLTLKLCTPIVGRSWLQRWLKARLSRNPISWLQQRSWTGRSVAFAWLAVMISFLTWTVATPELMQNFLELQMLIGFLLVLSIAAAAAGSFRQERENGALELILVTPLTVRQVIGGRVRGLWLQFLPAACLFLGAWLYLAQVLTMLPFGSSDWQQEFRSVIAFATTFAVLPFIGLYYSLKCRQFLVALIATVVTGVLLPKLLPKVATFLWLAGGRPRGLTWTEMEAALPWLAVHLGELAQIGLAVFLTWRLHQRLEERAFVLRT